MKTLFLYSTIAIYNKLINIWNNEKIISILVLLLFTITSCTSQDCTELPTSFSSCKEAVSEIKSTNFTIEDSVDTSRSSFIKSAHFYSCDSEFGYIIVKIKSKEYFYQNVPVSVWKQFKKANSFGSYYNRHIKGGYNLNFKIK